jgi:hypothetical protein
MSGVEEFKDEMLEFKNEMKEFKDEMQGFKDEMKEFKDEMQEFKDEMKEFKDEMRGFKNEMNKKWGEMARKMGTVVEDVVAPGFPYAIQEAFGLEIEDLMVRRRKKLKGRIREYDIIGVSGEFVFVVDVKNTYRGEYLEEFKRALEEFFVYFPELNGKKLVPVIASFYLEENIIKAASKRKIFALQLGGEYLEFVNLSEVSL